MLNDVLKVVISFICSLTIGMAVHGANFVYGSRLVDMQGCTCRQTLEGTSMDPDYRGSLSISN